MKPDEARDLFSAAWDGELEPAQQRELDAALASDPQLRAEWEEFADMLRQARALSEREEGPSPDLLAGVQTRLRVRSRGRFYRDRFSTQASGRSMLPLAVVLALAMLVAVAAAWITLHAVRVDAPADTPSSGS